VSGIDHLSKVSKEYQAKADEYERVAIDAAANEAEHKAQKARAVLRFKATRERMSQAEAETMADADEVIAQLYRDRLISAAIADAHREKLRQLKEQVASGRTYVASEREVDRMHAGGYGGGA
jgi:hypothetical protein